MILMKVLTLILPSPSNTQIEVDGHQKTIAEALLQEKMEDRENRCSLCLSPCREQYTCADYEENMWLALSKGIDPVSI